MDRYSAQINSSSLNGNNGFEIVGATPNSMFGISVESVDNLTANDQPAIVVGAVLENAVYIVLDASASQHNSIKANLLWRLRYKASNL